MKIIISEKGKDIKIVSKKNIEKESYLQNYIHKNPETIPVYELQEDKKLFVAKREFNTKFGIIDAIAFDKDGEIYVIETKLFKNSDKRQVVAQVLNYGAALWKHNSDFINFIEVLDQEIQNNFGLTFREKFIEFFNIEDDNIDLILNTIQSNLNFGIIKFVILMDVIDENLKDLIVYINQNSKFDIFAVQFELYEYDKLEIVIPKVFGLETKKNISKEKVSKMTDDDYILYARSHNDKIKEKALEQLLSFCKKLSKTESNIKLSRGMKELTLLKIISVDKNELRLFRINPSSPFIYFHKNMKDFFDNQNMKAVIENLESIIKNSLFIEEESIALFITKLEEAISEITL